MQSCRWAEESGRLVIRPSAGSMAAPEIATCVFVMTMVVLIADGLRRSMAWGYVGLNLILLLASATWLATARRPLVLDRSAATLTIGRSRTSLTGATGVAIRRVRGADADAYRVEVILAEERIWIGRGVWAELTDPAAAADLAGRVGAYLGVPVAEPAAEL
jgi:hypothetical protein